MTRRVLSVSGGKDSTAMLLWAIEQGWDFEAVTMDTGWEAPQTYEYLGYLRGKLGVKIKRLAGSKTLPELAVEKAMFPSRRFRYCTQLLKVLPFLEYIGEHEEVVNYVGIRAEESAARSMLPKRGRLEDADHVEVARPLLDWKEQDVIDMHRRHGLPPNPLYLLGVDRVGCWPCINASKAEIRIIANNTPPAIDRLRELEATVQKLQAKRLAAKGETWESKGWRPPTFFSLKEGPGRNRKSAHVPIDQVVGWAKTQRGGKQLMLDHGDGRRGCLRWGLCDA